jgi:tetratricopeptide (TPR) repeat protein
LPAARLAVPDCFSIGRLKTAVYIISVQGTGDSINSKGCMLDTSPSLEPPNEPGHRSRLRVASFLLAMASVPAFAAPQELVGECDSAQSMSHASAGRSSMANRDYKAAVTSFESALRVCPQEQTHHLRLAEAFTALGQFDDAIREAQEYLRFRMDSGEARLILANGYFRAQRFEECRRAVDQVLASDPRNLAALQLRANTDYLLGKDEEATRTLIRALDLYPNDSTTPYMLGRIYFQQNRVEHAVGQFQRVLKLDPNSYKAYDNLGLCYEALNQPDLAIRYYMTAIKLVFEDHPEYEWPYANLAELMLKRDEPKKAFSLAAEAAKRNPASARNFYLAGKALWKLEETDLALKWLDQSTRLDPNYSEPHYLLGQIYQRLGRKEDARKALQEFQRISKDAPRTRR